MAEKYSLPPNAESLCNSMRALGYSFQAAVADVIDNSIAAGATKIELISPPIKDPDTAYLAILDNGHGMNRQELIKAMQLACKNPSQKREDNDLGRFGLGLKTASLSQCRELIVISLKNGAINIASWDLDEIKREQDWTLLLLDKEETEFQQIISQLKKYSSGTAVIWRRFDRLRTDTGFFETAFREYLSLTAEHLSLVFHRFLEGETKIPRISMELNGTRIKPKDPFIKSSLSSVQNVPIYIRQGKKPDFKDSVVVKSHTLPEQSMLTESDKKKMGLSGRTLSEDQGFYIYRRGRLIHWGGWLGLRKMTQASKLCRVQVDVPASLDHYWLLDIKKSRAVPPKEVTKELKNFLEHLTEGSVKRQTGARNKKVVENSLWQTSVGSDDYSIEINRSSEYLAQFSRELTPEQNKKLSALLTMLELTLPIEWINAQYVSDRAPTFQKDLKVKIREVIATYYDESGPKISKEELVSMLLVNPMFQEEDKVSLVTQILNELENR
ncbi:ATP-binding protein [Parasutterella sp.]|jgi:hypothetical protein|uniref:ATP-binding protein n=2 Tax=Parasutterella TaxID=577310 RepID=UPI003522C9D7